MATKEPIGLILPGQTRYGDGSTNALYPHVAALPITYTISISKYASALPITYTLQKAHTASLLIYYLVTPVGDFAINGDSTIIRPDRITYTPRPVSARTLLGSPLLQGYQSMTWTYSVLRWSEFQQIIQYYNPLSPTVVLTYPDQNGTWMQKSVVMHPPNYGDMTIGQVVVDVALTFTRI